MWFVIYESVSYEPIIVLQRVKIFKSSKNGLTKERQKASIIIFKSSRIVIVILFINMPYFGAPATIRAFTPYSII